MTVFADRLGMVHNVPDGDGQPPQVTDVDVPVGVAVNVIGVPLTKPALHVTAVDAQLRPAGELVMLPVPGPKKFTVRIGPVLLRHATFAVMYPVTIAPDEDMFPALVFVVTVAETRAFPQARPKGDSRPVELTVTMFGVLEAQVTWSVMSLITGGWM